MTITEELSEEFVILKDIYDAFTDAWSSDNIFDKDNPTNFFGDDHVDRKREYLDLTRLQTVAWKFGVYPSQSQILEIHYSWNVGSPMKSITFHEFCVLIYFIKLQIWRGVPFYSSPECVSKPRRSLSQTSYNVFLGGACNPTTWRKDTAIPFLKANEISFFNPQVASWNPKLIELEESAKESSNVLLFVLDTCTRGIASMVEVAYLAGQGRNLVLVMPPNNSLVTCVKGDTLPLEEIDSIQRGYFFIRDLLERHGYPIFTDLHVALNCVKLLIETNSHVRNLTEASGAFPVKHGHYNVAKCMTNLHEQFKFLDVSGSGLIDHKEANMGLRVLLGNYFTLPPPKKLPLKDVRYNFALFCLLYCREVRRLIASGESPQLKHSSSRKFPLYTNSSYPFSTITLRHNPRGIKNSTSTTLTSDQTTSTQLKLRPLSSCSNSIRPFKEGFQFTRPLTTCSSINGVRKSGLWQNLKASYWWLISWLWPQTPKSFLENENEKKSTMKFSTMDFQTNDSATVPLVEENTASQSFSYLHDVYLGGSCGQSTWRQGVARPLLYKAGASFYNPQFSPKNPNSLVFSSSDCSFLQYSSPSTPLCSSDESSCSSLRSSVSSTCSSPDPHLPCHLWTMRLMPSEMQHREQSRVMLYVLTQETYGTGSLIECAFYIGRGCHIVLHVEMIDIENKNGSSRECTLSKAGMDDHNRGRSYLVALANQSKISVMDSVENAVLKAIELNRRLSGNCDISARSFTNSNATKSSVLSDNPNYYSSGKLGSGRS